MAATTTLRPSMPEHPPHRGPTRSFARRKGWQKSRRRGCLARSPPAGQQHRKGPVPCGRRRPRRLGHRPRPVPRASSSRPRSARGSNTRWPGSSPRSRSASSMAAAWGPAVETRSTGMPAPSAASAVASPTASTRPRTRPRLVPAAAARAASARAALALVSSTRSYASRSASAASISGVPVHRRDLNHRQLDHVGTHRLERSAPRSGLLRLTGDRDAAAE